MTIIKLIIFLSIPVCLPSYANDAHDIFYQAFNFAKKESPFSQQINWNSIETQALEFINSNPTACRGTSAIENVLAPALRKYDFHTNVTTEGLGSELCPIYQSQEISSYWQDYLQLCQDKRTFIEEKVNHFWGERFGDIAYIYVPSGLANSNDAIKARIIEGRKVIDSLNLETATGIIVDFRMNTGGHYFPMLMSIAKILKPETLFQYSNGEKISISEDGNTLTTVTPEGTTEILYHIDNQPHISRVALNTIILVDEGTSSSGAITAFAVKENATNSVLLGERTSQTFSVNTSLELKDGNYFNLMILRILSTSGIEQPLYLDVEYKTIHNFHRMFNIKDQNIKLAIKLLKR
ncbi:MAG: S41 family peptidase [Legionella sp.]|jgi:hypothetical protein